MLVKGATDVVNKQFPIRKSPNWINHGNPTKLYNMVDDTTWNGTLHRRLAVYEQVPKENLINTTIQKISWHR